MKYPLENTFYNNRKNERLVCVKRSLEEKEAQIVAI
jgi:hypothetical protein